MKKLLVDYLPFEVEPDQINESMKENNGKLVVRGVLQRAESKNQNGRVYPKEVLMKEVANYNRDYIKKNRAFGELGHPEGPTVNLDRVSHMLTSMYMDGHNGYGKLKILPTPMGKLVETMLQSGVKLGVSSRGSGNVDETTGNVSDFDIITVDVVAQPSAPNAYPTPIYESLLNMKHGHRVLEVAKAVKEDARAQRHLKDGVIQLIKDLKIG